MAIVNSCHNFVLLILIASKEPVSWFQRWPLMWLLDAILLSSPWTHLHVQFDFCVYSPLSDRNKLKIPSYQYINTPYTTIPSF